ncbi:MAG: serpin family protein [Simkaniaceae bacterium]|nr:serpin family protein [Simkaniaceae bacterium]
MRLIICSLLSLSFIFANQRDDLIAANQNFSFKLFSQFKESQNPILSPFSIESCLYMTYFGAQGLTEIEMKHALDLQGLKEKLPDNYRRLWAHLFNGPKAKDRAPLTLANSIWIDDKTAPLPIYQFIVQKNFRGTAEMTSFNNPDHAIQTINDWIATKTKGKIKQLLTSEDVNASTKMVLANAIFFKANWKLPFNKKLSYRAPFNVRDNVTQHVNLMHQIEEHKYSESPFGQCIALPFRSAHPKDLAFVVFLPALGKENTITFPQLSNLIDELQEKRVDLFLPTFEFEKNYSLSKPLMQLGMIKPFSTSADFSGITGEKNLYLSSVAHGTYFSVNEAGVEASGATSASLNLESMATAKDALRFEATRPFHYFILDLESKMIFFMGRFDKPEQAPVKKSFFSLGCVL